MKALSILSVLSLSIASLVFAPAALAGHGCCKNPNGTKGDIPCSDAKGSNCTNNHACGDCSKDIAKEAKKIF